MVVRLVRAVRFDAGVIVDLCLPPGAATRSYLLIRSYSLDYTAAYLGHDTVASILPRSHTILTDSTTSTFASLHILRSFLGYCCQQVNCEQHIVAAIPRRRTRHPAQETYFQRWT